MPVYRIESKDDPRVAVFRDLPRTRDRSGDGRFIVEGRVLVERLWRSSLRVESLFTDDSHLEFAVANSDPLTPILVATKAMLDDTIGFNFHRGLLACGVMAPAIDVAAYLEQQRPMPELLVVMDQVVDQENMGGVIRNAAALGASGVLIGPESARPFSRRVLRVSMGAVLSLPTLSSEDLRGDIVRLQAAGYHVAATMLSPNAIPITQSQQYDRTALVLGNEGQGLSGDWAELADSCVTIPMRLGVDSLNVASASAIFIHHCGRGAAAAANDSRRA